MTDMGSTDGRDGMARDLVIGVDLGGTSFKCGLLSPDDKIIARNQAPTNALAGPEQAAERIAQSVHALLRQAGLAGGR